jgi:hypothetical protein
MLLLRKQKMQLNRQLQADERYVVALTRLTGVRRIEMQYSVLDTDTLSLSNTIQKMELSLRTHSDRISMIEDTSKFYGKTWTSSSLSMLFSIKAMLLLYGLFEQSKRVSRHKDLMTSVQTT